MGVELKEGHRLKVAEKQVLRGRTFEPFRGSNRSRRKHALRSFLLIINMVLIMKEMRCSTYEREVLANFISKV
jgi:hypothetical protein